MNTNYRQLINMPSLQDIIGTSFQDLSLREKKAVKNIKGCANDQWQFVNGWYDERNEDYRSFMMNPKELYSTIYSDSLDTVYYDGGVGFGAGAERFLKDIRFCGKKFLQTVAFYYTAKLLEESVIEVEGTEEDAARVGEELKALKEELGI